MGRTIIFRAALMCVVAASLTGVARAEEPRDVTFRVYSMDEKSNAPRFCYNERAVGTGRAAFEEILDRIAKLPAGTSIAWGPDYARCGSCNGAEPGWLPKNLWPDLWKRLEETVAARKLILSSDYPIMWLRSVRDNPLSCFPKETYTDHAPVNKVFDAAIDWQIVKDPDHTPESGENTLAWQHRFSSNKKTFEGFDLATFLGRLPEGSSVLLKMSFPEGVPEGQAAVETALLEIQVAWLSELSSGIVHGNLKPAVVIPAALPPLPEPKLPDGLHLHWKNYHGPRTPPDEVLYFIGGDYIGRGKEAIDSVLKRMDQLPAGSPMTILLYGWSGRYSDGDSRNIRIERLNEKLKDLVPFPERRTEVFVKISERKLDFKQYGMYAPGPDNGTVLEWSDHRDSVATIAKSGRIVHHTQLPHKPAARLGWVRYDANERRERKLETTACYTIDEEEMGEGIAGFAKAMDRIVKLPEGSVLHVRVCLRTKGPFLCPIIYEGLRHFERTGFEPYFGMFDWLLDVAKQRKLQIEWIPDEAESCRDCQLNM